MRRRSLGILASHPIQYQAPWFRELAQHLDLTVYFAHRQTPEGQAAAGFGTAFEWDVDLTSGYRAVFLRNSARRPSTDRFWGCRSPEIDRVIASSGHDALLVLGWYLWSFLQAMAACRRHRVPVLVRSDSQLRTRRGSALRFVKRLLYTWGFGKIDRCLAVGTRSREYFAHYGVPAGKTFIVPHCVDEARFRTASGARGQEAARLRRNLGIHDEELVLLFVGKLIPRKRPLDMVRALHHLKSEGVRVIGLFAGDGELRQVIGALARDLDVGVEMLGFRNQSELPHLYEAADILVLPSDASETWGLVVNEAMRCGRPAVVSRDVGCAPDLVESGKTGEQFTGGDPRELAAAVSRFIPLLGTEHVRRSLEERMRTWSTAAAVDGTLGAIEGLSRGE